MDLNYWRHAIPKLLSIALCALCATGRDLKERHLLTILTLGKRYLFMFNTVHNHRKLRRAGVRADL